jgi:hypothetical protein
MNSHVLDLTPLERAVARLQEGWARYQQDVSETFFEPASPVTTFGPSARAQKARPSHFPISISP